MSLTVVVSSYNRPDSLARAVRSAVQQPSVERVIVVDDASPTPLKEINAGGRVHWIRHVTNRGICAVRNSGLAEVRTRYVAFLDDDDCLPPDAYLPLLEALSKAMGGSAPIGAAVGSVQVLQDGRISQHRVPPNSRPGEIWGLDAHLLSEPGHSFACKQSAVYPTDFLRGLGGWNEALRSRSQTELFFRICQRAAVVGVPHVAYELSRDDRPRLTGDRNTRKRSYRYLVKTYADLLSDRARRQYFERNHRQNLSRPSWWRRWLGS